MTHARRLTAAYQLRTSHGDTCATCREAIPDRKRVSVNLATGAVECEPCYLDAGASAYVQRRVQTQRNLVGRCADCGVRCFDPATLATVLPDGALVRCLGCSHAGGQES